MLHYRMALQMDRERRADRIEEIACGSKPSKKTIDIVRSFRS